MRKSILLITFRPLLSTCLLLASCSGQAPVYPKAAATAPLATPTSAPADAAQIAEYVVAAFEDDRGNLWFGTNGQGVARWDGESLRYFSIGDGLVGDVVTGITKDSEGNLWFGTHTGASRYDGRTFSGFSSAEGLHGSGCKLLVDRNGTVWAGTSDGAFRFDGERFNAFELPIPAIDRPSHKIVPGKVWDLFEDSKGNIWFARDGYGACKYDGRSFTHFTKRDGLCSNNVASIVEDGQGSIWFGSITSDHPEYIAEGGVTRYDGRTFTVFPELKGLTSNDVYNLHADRSGRVWIGAVRVGAYRFDPSVALGAGGSSFTFFDKTDRPDLTTVFGVQAMVEDRHGTMWFGFSGGLFRFNGSSFVNVTRGGPWASP